MKGQPSPHTTFTKCAKPGCDKKLADHAWGRIKADGWFQQKNGAIWCPDHIPAWVEGWRRKKS